MPLTNHRVTWRPVAAAVLLFFAATVRAADLRVVGSDLLGIDFFKSFYAFAVAERLPLALALDGSRPGLDQLQAGRAELGLLVLPPGDEPDPSVFTAVPLGWHRVVVIAPASAPLAQVSFAQLAAIFGADVPVGYHRWGDLGLVGEWAASPIVALAPVAGLGLSAEYFGHAVLSGRSFKSQVRRYTSPADLALRLAGDGRALALAAGFPSGLPDLKMMPVSVRPGAPAFFPTPENLHSGDYPLRLPLRIVFRREAAGRIQPLLRWLLSDSTARLLESAEIVPVPSSERHRQLLALEKNERENLRK